MRITGSIGLEPPRLGRVTPTMVRQVAIVLASVGCAALITPVLATFIARTEFLLLYTAVAVSAACARLGGGLLATVAGLVAVEFFVLPRLTEFDTQNPHTAFSIAEFAAVSVLIVAVAEALRRARRRLTGANADLSRALDEANVARRDAVEQADRLRLLDQVSSVLASSLNYEAAVAATARLAVSGFADWCSVDVLVGDQIKQLAADHVDDARLEAMSEARAREPLTASASTGLAEVIRTGETRFAPEATDEFLAAQARSPAHLATIRKLGIRSAMIVPMAARGHIIGALTLVRLRPAVPFDDGSLTLARDIARRAAVAIDNAHLYHRAVEANETKANFLATMSHELRTPLTAIIGYDELLEDEISGPVNDVQREQLDRIRVNAKQLLSLIEEILLHARIDAGREPMQLSETLVKEVLEESMMAVAPLAERKRLEFTAETVAPGLSLVTDGGKLRQMLVNLLANAVKFTERGKVTVRAFARDADIVFEVQDTGIGIAKENREQIFEPFWQVEQSKTRKTGGSGLGLSTTHRLANALGGNVSVDSELGVGSTFRLTLPRQPRGG